MTAKEAYRSPILGILLFEIWLSNPRPTMQRLAWSASPPFRAICNFCANPKRSSHPIFAVVDSRYPH